MNVARRRGSSPAVLAVSAVGLVLLAPAAASAQPPAPPAASAPRPPRLATFVEATWPAGAREAGRTAVVLLQLTISATGQVTAAEVRTSGGEDFDAAALEAARRFVFEPAVVGGRPVASQIAYRYRFVQRVEAPTTARFEGVVRDRRSNAGLPDVRVDLGEGLVATTDAQGRFAFERVPPGERAVALSREGMTSERVTERFVAGQAVTARYDVSLTPPPPPPTPTPRAAEAPVAEVVIRGSLRRSVVSTEVGADQARRIPGTQGDVLRVIESLPGVGRASAGSGQLVVWGAAPEDTRVLLDGVPIPRLYHEGGLRSVVPGELVQSVELVPGGYGAAYGRGLGGMVIANTRPLDGTGVRGALSADLYDAAASVRADLGRGVRAGVGARRSHLDALLDATGAQVSSVFPIPRYFDAQTRLSWDISRTDRVELSALLSRDAVTRRAPSPDPARDTQEDRALGFERVWARWRRTLERGELTVVSWFGRDARAITNRVGALSTSLESERFTGGVRATWRRRLSAAVTLDAGVDLEAADTSLRRVGSVGLPAREGDRRTFGQPIPDQVNADRWRTTTLAVAPWVEADFTLANGRVHVVPSLRVDPYLQRVSRRTPVEGDLPAVGLQREDFTVEPRISLRWSPVAALTLKAAAGRYAQLPQPEDQSAVFGTPTLGVSRATHALVGASWRVIPSLVVEATVFGTLSEGLAQRSDDPAPLRANALVATGEGRAFGAQVLIRQELARGLMGWVSYAVLRSERRSGPDAAWRLFDQDQTHVLTALVSWEPGRGWELGARVRYATGMPRTPVVGAWFDAPRDQWQPVLGAQNSTRLPDFVQLDVRVAKTFAIGASRLELSLDVQNVTNRENPEEVTWNAAWTRSGYITGLPILPVLGLRWTL